MTKRLWRKAVIIGDGACGKTSLLLAFINNSFSEGYTPTIYETDIAYIDVDKTKVNFN